MSATASASTFSVFPFLSLLFVFFLWPATQRLETVGRPVVSFILFLTVTDGQGQAACRLRNFAGAAWLLPCAKARAASDSLGSRTLASWESQPAQEVSAVGTFTVWRAFENLISFLVFFFYRWFALPSSASSSALLVHAFLFSFGADSPLAASSCRAMCDISLSCFCDFLLALVRDLLLILGYKWPGNHRVCCFRSFHIMPLRAVIYMSRRLLLFLLVSEPAGCLSEVFLIGLAVQRADFKRASFLVCGSLSCREG